jgi:thymidylate synthase (FAD)
MKVELISYTPEPEAVVAAAAKLCYTSSSICDLRSKIVPNESGRFIRMLAKMGHESPLEHANFMFGMEGVSRSFLSQITRHRIASFSVQSQRYVQNKNPEFVTPPEIATDIEAKVVFESAMADAWVAYDKLTSILKKKHKSIYLAQNMDERKAETLAEKAAIEDARFVLPNAAETKIVCTFNARSLMNFFAHRCCNRAQWEIRTVAEEMLRLVSAVAPNIFSFAGPSCRSGKCPEGLMSCGKMHEVREKYREITGSVV